MSRVLLAHPSAELYGSDRMALETVRILVEAGHRVFVVVPEDGLLVGELRGAGAEVGVVSVPVIRKSALKPLGLVKLVFGVLAAIPAIFRYIVAARPDVLYANTIVQPWWMIVARLLRVRVVVHVREAERDAPRLVRRILLLPLRAAHVVIANSGATAEQLRLDARSLSSRTIVVYNGKDWSDYGIPEKVVTSHGLRVLFVGRLNPRKGPDIAIDAVAALARRGIDVNLDIAGDVFPGYEWFEQDLRARVADLGIEHRVTFYGFVARPIELLELCDVLVVPSRVEPFGTVAAEGMAASRPVVVADIQGLVEIVTDEITGLVVPTDDPDSLAGALERLARDTELRSRLARAGSESVRERFTRDRYAFDILTVIERQSTKRSKL